MVRHAKENNGVAKRGHEMSRWRSGAKVRPVELEWLLPGRIIAGSLCVVEGETSVGKSTFLAALAASVTSGKPWMDRLDSTPSNVLWISGEEDFASMVAPRLKAAGADLDRVHVPEEDENGEPYRVFLPESIPSLRECVADLRISLIIMEPLSSMVGPNTDLNQIVSSRLALDPLQRMAMATRTTCVITRGLRKDRNGPRTSWGQGSAAIGDTARSVLSIDAPDPLKPHRILRVVKCSRSPATPPVRYEITRTELGPVMTGLQAMTRADDLESESCSDAGERSVREDARRLLRKMLAAGWIRATTVRVAAEDAMVSINTLRRAAAELGVVTKQSWDGNSSYHEWGPPEGGFPEPTPPPALSGHLGNRVRKSRKKAEN